MIKINTAWYLTNYSCNNKCLWCYAGSAISKNVFKEKTSFKNAKKAVDFLSMIDVKRCILLGGESTLLPYLSRLIKYGSDKNIEMGLVTNGIRTKDENYLKELFTAGLPHITFSLEGHTAQLHDYVTQNKGSFKSLLSSIDNCKSNDFSFSTLSTISSITAPFAKEIAAFSNNIGSKIATFNLCSPSIAKDNLDFVLPPVVLARIIEELGIFVVENKLKSKVITPLPKCVFNKKIATLLEKHGFLSKSRGCQIFSGNALVVDFNGDVLPCSHWSNLSLFNIAEVKSKKQFEIKMEKGIGLKLRKSIWRYPSYKCMHCPEWGKTCVGGCPLLWLKYNPSKELDFINNRSKSYE